MADRPISVGDHVSGLKRDPDNAPRWWKPPLLGVLVAFFAAVACFAVIVLAMGFCYLFWMEGVGRWINTTMETSVVPLNIVRFSVLAGFAVMLIGFVRCALLRYQESMS